MSSFFVCSVFLLQFISGMIRQVPWHEYICLCQSSPNEKLVSSTHQYESCWHRFLIAKQASPTITVMNHVNQGGKQSLCTGYKEWGKGKENRTSLIS